MDFALTPDAEAFRSELRAFLDAHHPGSPPKGGAERVAHGRAWAALLADHGFAAPAWPREWGGMELPLASQLVYHEEFARARVPSHPSPLAFIVGPTLIRHGSDAQRKRFLEPMVRADEQWCQGFSEPGAGSDLPALRTRAVRDGDDYVVNGQKLWTTRASQADWMFALVRTGSQEARQDGISYLLVDMRSPGITTRPLRDMSGRSHFSEVFLEDVRVPVANRVGDEDGGWRIARTSLGHERSTAFISSSLRYGRVVDELIELARTQGVAGQPHVRQRLARIVTAVRLLRLNGMRSLSAVVRGEEPGAAASVSRLFTSEFEQDLHELAVDIIGPLGQLDPRSSSSVQGGRWVWGFLQTRASTIGAGTAEIQRNTIAEGVLGLPHDPDIPTTRGASSDG